MASKLAVSFLALCALSIIKPAQGGIGLGGCPERTVINPIDLSKVSKNKADNDTQSVHKYIFKEEEFSRSIAIFKFPLASKEKKKRKIVFEKKKPLQRF